MGWVLRMRCGKREWRRVFSGFFFFFFFRWLVCWWNEGCCVRMEFVYR